MALHEATSKLIIVSVDTETEKGPEQVEIARVYASGADKSVKLIFAKSIPLGDLRSGMKLSPSLALNIAQALYRAVDLIAPEHTKT